MEMLKIKPIFRTEHELAEWIRSRFEDGDKDSSDEFLVNESFSLGEWDFNEEGEYEISDKMLKPFRVSAKMTIGYEEDVLAYSEDDIVLGETIDIDDMTEDYDIDSEINEITQIKNKKEV